MRRYLHNLGTVVGISLITVLAANLLGFTVMYSQGARIATVQTSSMQPSFSIGDGLLLRPAGQYRVGDVVRYPKAGVTVTHRVVEADDGWLITKGDAVSDPDQPIPARAVLGKVVAVAPGLGRVLDRLQQPGTLAAIVYIPAILLISYEVIRIARELRAPYRLFGYR